MNEYIDNAKFANAYMDQIIKILHDNLGSIIDIRISTPDEDMKNATDLIVTISSGDVDVRIRRYANYHDLTLRAYNKSHKTEINKIREGYAKWYLYVWTDGEKIIDWVLLDLDKLRGSGILNDQRKIIMNKDNVTGFTVYPIQELVQYDIVVAART